MNSVGGELLTGERHLIFIFLKIKNLLNYVKYFEG